MRQWNLRGDSVITMLRLTLRQPARQGQGLPRAVPHDIVPVLICSHTRGGRRAAPIACPTARVESTRELIMAGRLAGV